MRYPRTTQSVAVHAATSRKFSAIYALIFVAVAVAAISILLFKASPSVESKQMTTVFAAGRGTPFLTLGDGKAVRSRFHGSESATLALGSNLARPRSLATADFDSNGTPDVVAGYEVQGRGLLTLHKGNPDAYAPTDQSVFTRMQQGYNPAALLPDATAIELHQPADFVAAGDFNGDNRKDILTAARNGGLLLLAGQEEGFAPPVEITLPGAVTALTTGEFRAADGTLDLAIGIDGFNGPQVLVYDTPAGVNGESIAFPVQWPVSAVEFAALDTDPFMDLAASSGSEAVLIHGWGRKRKVNPQSQVERVDLGFEARGLATGFFIWNRKAKEQVAVLADNGMVRMLNAGELQTQPFTEAEIAERAKARLATKRTGEDVEQVIGWQQASKQEWETAREFMTESDGSTRPGNGLLSAHLSGAETDNLLLLRNARELKIMQQIPPDKSERAKALSGSTDIGEISLPAVEQPTAVLRLPKKLNGEGAMVMLQESSASLSIIPEEVVVDILVDRTDDAVVSACTGAPNDCTLRGAIQVTNGNTDTAANNKITIPNGTYVLSINGAGGCVTENNATGNTIGDLELNKSTTLLGGGMNTTIIRQAGTGNASFPGDRVMCLNVPLTIGLNYVFSGFTIAGGFDRSQIGGGGLVGGAKDNTLSLTNIRITNNDNTATANYSGGGLSITGGSVTITNSLIGGPTAADSNPAVTNDRTDLNRGNYAGTAGGGIGYSPGDPIVQLPSVGTLTVTGTTVQGNKANSGATGGGGLDLFLHNSGTGSFTINGSSVVTGNSALNGNGGGVIIESGKLTVDSSTFTSNSTVGANTRGGAIYLSGGGLSFGNSTSFSNNTAIVTAGNCISVNTGEPSDPNTGVFVTGTGNNIDDNVEVLPNGRWTNNTGTSVIFESLTLLEGTFVGNNSTLTVNANLNLNDNLTADSCVFTGGSGTHTITGNLNIADGAYTATSATTNMAGNFNLTGGSFVHSSGTFLFNGTGAQSITGAVTFNNLTDSNITQPLTINSSINANGSLNVNGVNAVLAPVAAAVIGGSGTLTGTGTARVTRTAATAGFSNQYTITNKTLTNLTVEYIGAAAQVLSAITYGPLKINNGSGVNLTGTANVDGLLTLQTGALGVGTGTLVINNGSTVVGGSITSSATGTVNYNQSSGGQNVLAFNYGNLIFSNFQKNLPSATVGIAGTFTPGSGVGHVITGNTIDFNGAGAQTIPAFQYNNLTISGARGGANVTLVNGGTISVLGAFSPTATTVNYVITNNTFDFNGTGAQTVAAFNYNNLTISQNRGGAALTLASGSIGIAGVFNPTLTNNTFVTTGNTVIFNGSAAQTIPAFTFNGLTISNAAGVNLNGAVTVGGALSLTSGAFGVGTHILTLNGAASTSGGTLTSSTTGTVNYNQNSNGQAVLAGSYGNLIFSNFNKTLASTGTIAISNVFTPGTATGHTITGSTIDFNSTAAQSVPAFNYNNLTISGARGGNNVTLANSGIIGIAGVFSPTATFAGGSIVITGSTIEYNGSSAQTMPPTFTTYNNLNLNNAAGVTGFAGLTVQGLLNVKAGTFTSSSSYNNVTIDASATLTATAGSTINVTGNWLNNGTFNGGTGTVAFNGSSAQTIGGSSVTAFTSLTIANSAGVSLTQNATVNGTLTLNSDLTTGANTLSQPSTAPASAGAFDVVGNVRRTGSPLPSAVAMTFGNLNNIITFNAVGTTPNDVTINLVKSAPVAFPSAVQRTYTITPNGGAGFSGTLRLRYLDSELNSNVESQLDLWRFNGSTFVDEQQTSRDAVNNWVQKTGVTTFSPWTFATHVNAAPTVTPATTVVNAQTTSGLVITADAIDGAAVTHFKITNITNGSLFKNDGVTAINNNDFITLAEGNAGLKFTPALNSIAAGSFNAQASSDATGTGLSPAATGTITVNQGSTTTTITADSPDPSGTGASVTVNFSVVANLPSSGTPTGNVVVTVNDASGDTCNGNLSSGTGTCNLTLTTAGSKTLTATYGGDTLFTTSFDTEPHDVNGPPVAVDDNYTTLKGSPLNVAAPGVLANDTGSPTDVTAIASGPTTAGGTVTLNTNGSFTYNPPTAVFTGADSFTYTANNAFGSDSGTVNITVVDAFFINEVLFDPPGTDAPNEYIELRGPASAAIPAGTYLVAIEGDSAENPGDVQTIINLSGLSFGSNGFLVLLQNGNTYATAAGTTVVTSTTTGFGGLPGAIFSADAAATDLEDTSVTFLLIQAGTAPTLTDDIDANDDGTRDGAAFTGWTLIDSIGALNGGANVRGYGAYHYRQTGGSGTTTGTDTSVAFVPSYVGRNGDSVGATAADWVASGGLAGTAPNFTLNATDTEPIAFANQPLNHIGATNFDISPPSVTSITRANANPTNATSVDFTVTFSETVTGVGTADFALTTTGTIAGASISMVAGMGNVFTVSVNTGTGNGTIRLDLIDDNTIIDGSNNPLGGAGTQNFTTGQVYDVDKVVPTVDITDVTPDPRGTSVSSISIVFNEAVTGFDLADLTLTRNGGGNLLTGSQTLTTSDNITWTLGNLSTITGTDGTYVLTLTAAGSSINDTAGNALGAGASDTWIKDATLPTADITDVTPDPRTTSVASIAIVFSEAITGFDLADLSLTRNGGANLLTGAQTLTSGDNINWTLGNLGALTGTDGAYVLTLTASGSGIQDANANGLAGDASDTWVRDATGPSVTINQASGQADPTSTSPINFTVVFTEAVTNFINTDVGLSGTAGATTAVVTETAPNNGTTYNVAVSGMTGSGSVIATLAAGVASDALGNVSQASTSTDNVVQFNLITNVAPVLDNTGNMTLAAINEDVADASNPGTLVSAIIASAGGDRITDADAGALEGIAVIAANNANGTWQYSINNGTNWTAFGAPNATTARLLAADVNTRVRFVPNANFNGTVTPGITFRAWDQTTGANGGTADVSVNGGNTAFSAATETADITVNAVNDAPTANAQAVVTNEGTPVGITLTGSDVETAAGSLSFNVTVQPTNGVLSGTAPNLTYTPNADFNGADSFKFTVTDTGDGASPALTSTEATVSITVDAVNDAPVNTVPGAQSTATNVALTFSAGNGNLISIADVDAGSSLVQVTLTATNGTFSLSGTAGLLFSVGDGTADAAMTFTGTITNINAALNGLVFTPTAGFNGAASLQIITNDQGNTGSGGAKSDTDAVSITVTAGGTVQFSAATYTVAENAGPATITITRSGGTAGTATVLFQTSHGTAGAGDYTTVSQTVTFVDGDTSETVNIPITNDSSNEPDETVNLTLSNPGGSATLGAPSTAVLTITNDDTPTISFSQAAYSVAENGLNIDITVNRTGDASAAASVNYQTSDLFGLADCGTINGNASNRCDYLPALGTLNFAAGQTSRTFRVFVSDDVRTEGAEVLTLTLSAPAGGVLGATNVATLTINDHVVAPGTPNPIDDAAFFIRMLYIDILSREPDTIGFNNWLATINGCPNGGFGNVNTTCDRVHVAKSFFGSLEFGERGYFVYRFYDAGLGQRPGYTTFLRGMQQIGGGLSPADSTAAKMAFVNDFIASPEFQAIYTGLLVPAQANAFITKLEQTSGITIPEPTRGQLVSDMASSTKTPAETLKAFMETPAVFNGYFNRGFVSMLYFGYLHRDPDTVGFNNWLTTLNATGDYRHLTFGFIYSPEYRSRFGQP